MHLSAVVLLSAVAATLALDGLEDKYGTVEYVNILFRHGARTPDALPPGDPHRDMKNWPEGLRQLTKEGVIQHYNLGSWLYKRYRHLLPSESERGKVNEALKVVSTDWDRTLMSANAEMFGLFPIIYDGARWYGLPSFPVPVHSMPSSTDQLLEVTADCPRYLELVREFESSNDYQAILQKYEPMTEELVRHSGNVFHNLDFYMELFTNFFIEEGRGLPLPDWVKKWYPSPMVEPTILSFIVPTWTTEMKRLRGGPFIKEVVNNMWNKMNNKSPQNISMYSAHDTTISAFLNSMGVFNQLPPPFASMVLVELREKVDKQVVLIWYKNSTSEEPVLLTVPRCEPACPLTKFQQLMRPVIPHDWKQECKQKGIGVRFSGDELKHLQTVGKRKGPEYFKEDN